MADPVFKRILLKLSGEALMGELNYGTDPERVSPLRPGQRCARPWRRGGDRGRRSNIYRG